MPGLAGRLGSALANVSGELRTGAARQEFGEMLVTQGAVAAGVHEAAVKRGTASDAELARRGGQQSLDLTRRAYA